MIEKVECKNDTCNAEILVLTAANNEGYCIPCVQRMQNEARLAYIKKHRKTVDPYAGVSDPVELIKIYHEERPYNPLVEYLPLCSPIEAVYRDLSEFDVSSLIKHAIQQAESGHVDSIEAIGTALVAFRNSNVVLLHHYMLKHKIYYPSIIFKNAASDVVNTLLNEVHRDSENRNRILLALAWASNSDVVMEFGEWSRQAPKWSGELYIPPYQYSQEAGWDLDSLDKKRNLFFDKCYSLMAAKADSKPSTCNTCTPSNNECQWCGRELTNLLEIDLTDSKFDFLGIQGECLKITTCDACASYSEGLFMEYDTQGNSLWSRFNTKPEYLPEDLSEWEKLPVMPLVMSANTRSAHHAANWLVSTTCSQIGGMPTWIQDFSYLTCPCCESTMMFVAQLSNDEIHEYGEGTYYMHICRDCQISAVNYQQT
ncbi:hypothetical protein L4C34_17720 [Vibrio profundum]|uniref:hypothetical protein n=1 Tax=Vibrio profundum TaxID=2910247 RepID=UPI003D0F995E